MNSLRKIIREEIRKMFLEADDPINLDLPASPTDPSSPPDPSAPIVDDSEKEVENINLPPEEEIMKQLEEKVKETQDSTELRKMAIALIQQNYTNFADAEPIFNALIQTGKPYFVELAEEDLKPLIFKLQG